MAQNTKINLDENIKIGKLFLESSQFNLPTQLFVDFTSARPSSYDENNVQQNEVQKYTLNGVEVSTGQALVKAGVNLSKFEGIHLEVIGNLEVVEDLIDQKFVGTVKLVNPRVKPLWVSRGQSGNFSKLKLVVEAIESLPTK